jgi:hypothetical protein
MVVVGFLPKRRSVSVHRELLPIFYRPLLREAQEGKGKR